MGMKKRIKRGRRFGWQEREEAVVKVMVSSHEFLCNSYDMTPVAPWKYEE